MDNNKRIVEIGGVKLEVDLRHAKVIDNYKVGTKVKILVKDYSGYTPHPGIIVGFDNFDKLPTIKVAYLTDSRSDPTIEFAYVNESSLKEKYELCPIGEYDFELTQEQISSSWDKKILKAQKNLEDMKVERRVFEDLFGVVFSDWKSNVEKLSDLINSGEV